jgi:hypothetical protein
MTYNLDQFVADCRLILKGASCASGREEVRLCLERLLRNPDFVRRYCIDAAKGLHVLYDDAEFGFQVLAHLNEKPRVSSPHDHGSSWAIYGQAIKYTDMTEWERVDDGSDPTHATLTVAREYRLSPGHAGLYQDGRIHSIDYPADSCFVRVTGTDLDRIPRMMFDRRSGRITRMTPQRAS